MKKLQFTTAINAAKDKVWDALWKEENYKRWTAVFSEGSYAESDWQEGSKILFLSGNGDGMYSQIEKKIPGEFMAFKHIGMVKDKIELPVDEQTKSWSGATETYRLSESGGVTTLLVELDITEDHANYFNEAFPKALAEVKKIAEEN